MAEELVALALSGKTFEQIAEQYGVKRPASVFGAYTRGKKLVIEKLRKQGNTWDEINEHFKNEPHFKRSRQTLTDGKETTECAVAGGGY
jgi:hypothetical protein